MCVILSLHGNVQNTKQKKWKCIFVSFLHFLNLKFCSENISVWLSHTGNDSYDFHTWRTRLFPHRVRCVCWRLHIFNTTGTPNQTPNCCTSNPLIPLTFWSTTRIFFSWVLPLRARVSYLLSLWSAKSALKFLSNCFLPTWHTASNLRQKCDPRLTCEEHLFTELSTSCYFNTRTCRADMLHTATPKLSSSFWLWGKSHLLPMNTSKISNYGNCAK